MLFKITYLSIVNNYGNINIDGIIKVEKGLVNNNCNLIEENLFIGKKGNIKASPQLLIKSNDIKASHSCNIDRVDEQLLYYLSTRGIQINKGIKLILESKIKYLFKKIINDQSILIEEKFDDLLLNLV